MIPNHPATDLARALLDAAVRLGEAGVDTPAVDAKLLAAHVLSISPAEVDKAKLLGQDFDAEQAREFADLVEQRSRRIPVQHLTGTAAFYGLDIPVRPGVFIPRPETEILVEHALNFLTESAENGQGSGRPLRAIDLCTGTGAIGLALGHELAQSRHGAEVFAVEIDGTAAELATANAQSLNIGLSVVQADATDLSEVTRGVAAASSATTAKPVEASFDVVVSNPPYIPATDLVSQPEASLDPSRALYGGSDDGTLIPLRIAEVAAELLRDGGLFMMEHDHTHAEALRQTLAATGTWSKAVTVPDLAGQPRFFAARRTPRSL